MVLRAQEEQRGLGHAVYQVRDWVGKEPFIAGSWAITSLVRKGAKSCARQLVERFEALETSLIGLQATPEFSDRAVWDYWRLMG